MFKLEHLCKLILHPRGLFNRAQGERILFINKVEEPKDLILAKLLSREVSLLDKDILSRILMGSLKNDLYFS